MALSMALVFWGTLAQVHLGTYNAQKEFFNSFFVFERFGSISLPVFPGGLTLGFVWLASLSAAFVVRFRLERAKIGLYISHAGLIVLLAGQLFTQLFSIETQLPIQIGETRNYSESARDTELVLIDRSNPAYDEVISVPISHFKPNARIELPEHSLHLVVREFHENSRLMINEQASNSSSLSGVGARIRVESLSPVSHDEEVNNPTAIVDVIESGESRGAWLVSAALGTRQEVHVGGKTYEIAIRSRRTYFPFTLTLKEFNHDVYPGTDIPKNFSSLVHVTSADGKDNRDALIYMNNPLRYQGKTFYQASFGNNNTLSVFQVVENPFAASPYISCSMILLGLAIHFLMTLLRFLRKPQ